MTGHEPILEMRLAGVRPSSVSIDDFKNPIAKDWHNPGAKYGEVWEPDSPSVQIDPTDRIEALDLRFLVGVAALVSGSTESRAKALSSACKRAGASMVIASHSFPVNEHRSETGWMEVWNKGAV